MNYQALIRHPLATAMVVQIAGLAVAWSFDCIGEAVIASAGFWALVEYMARRKTYTKVDVHFVRYGLILFIAVVVVIHGSWGVPVVSPPPSSFTPRHSRRGPI
jgi:hypothetical protein